MRSRIAVLASVALLSTACGGGAGKGASAEAASASGSGGGTASGSGTQNITIGASSSSRSSSSAATSVAASSSSSSNTGIVWTPAAPAPGQVTTFSPDSTIAANSVVTFGQTFSQGEMPAAVTATYGGSNLATQTDVKRTHPDGSIRHAIISVRLPAITAVAPAQASIAYALNPSGSNAAGSPISLASVNSAGSPVDYRVEIIEHGLKADGTATTESGKTWTTTLKSALSGTVEQWMSGALVSEWRARVAPSFSGSAHPGLRVIFDARYQSTTQGRVSIAIENVESNAARGNRTYDLRIYDATTGGNLVHNKDNVLHYAHTRFRKVLYFGTGVKELLATVDTVRLKASRAIPNYANITIPGSELTARYTAWQGSNRDLYEGSVIQTYFPSTGGREDIGPLPGWTARALISGDPRMYQVMFDLAERSGFFNVHWRDSLRTGATLANADVFSIDVHPQFSLFNPSSNPVSYVGSTDYNRQGDSLPAPSLPFSVPSNSWQVDIAHQPSLVFAPYVVTGDHYYLDELNFWAAWDLVSMAYDYREDGKGLLKAESQSRGQAWAMRTMGHASWIAPTGNWHAAYFANKLSENFNWFRNNILAGNPLGYWHWINPADTSISASGKYELQYSSPQLAKVHSPWMHNFVAYTLYELSEKGFPATDLRDKTLNFSVKLFTSSPDFNPLDGTAYRLPAELIGGLRLMTMADVSYHAFSGLSYAARNPNAGSSPSLESGGDPDGYASIALAALSAAINTTSGDIAVPSSAYVFVRNHAMSGGNTMRIKSMGDPTWNIVPFGTVVGLTEAPGIYTK